MILVLGSDDALLEGLAQALAASGQAVHVARTLDDVEELAAREPLLLVVADRAQLTPSAGARLARLASAAGSAVVAYRGQESGTAALAFPPELARLTLADLELPLERNRLVALALYVAARAREVGRVPRSKPPAAPEL
jgi:hypothetical protein